MARFLVAGCLCLVFGACTGTAPSSSPEVEAPSASPVLGSPGATPAETTLVGIPAPAGVTTTATVSGAIYLGFEACVGLTPGPESQYVPPPGPERDFVLSFPKGWRVVPAHPRNPRYGDHFKILDRSGNVVARDGDVLEVTGQIKAISATICGFGWPIRVRQAVRLGA